MTRDESASRSRLPGKFTWIKPCPKDTTEGRKVENLRHNDDSNGNDVEKEEEDVKEDVAKVVDQDLQPDLLR